ncbi:MAG: nucleotide pyrophosphohydrolase [Nanoarchaeota archaeon]|nr:nucleotide pyrophosphohydrolase [Nanoarchaeota archaeon]MBU1644495.1 nucleotide pyrophosphohydrolase [Nanoarchaeota archaeon]MBU1976499.1 nucleotide pyrophosphohydrolase [Nanoarchaeota archaeon]
MKDSFEELYLALKIDRNKSEWSKERTLQERAKHLETEVKEVLEAIEKKDLQNLHEELGDVLWGLLAVMIIAEEENNFEIKNIINNTLTKLKRRKPWIFNGEEVNSEEELNKWKKVKEQGKNERN